MNTRVLFRLLSAIVATLIVAFSASLFVSNQHPDSPGEEAAIQGFSISIIIAAAVFFAFAWFGRKAGTRIHRKEALAVIGLGWILASALGALPYIFSLKDISPVDAWFESASGLTTTGATIFADVESLPRGLHFWRCLSQWLGGMGVVVFFVAILGFLGAGGKLLYANEATGSVTDFDQARIQTAVGRIQMLYLGLSSACLVAYRFAGLDWFDAWCHMFTTVSTGGYGTRNASLAAFASPWVEWTAITFMFLGGASFVVQLRILRGNLRAFSENTEVKAYAALLFSAGMLVFACLWVSGDRDDLHGVLRGAYFQVTSIATTTGYATEDFGIWPTPAKMILLILMFAGGCSSSTAGGLKIVRVCVAWKACLTSIEESFRPRVVRPLRINGRNLDLEDRRDILEYLVLAALLTMASVPLVALLDPGLSFEGAIGATVACLFNIGPGFAEVGPMNNYGGLAPGTKVFLSGLMIMGRIELYAILALFLPTLWRRFR